ncbi:MAG TPA: bifunctional oligoribonuclease/PAP phosphatase NrnA [bacterium]|nr:bifunctional oligoribonuclease/PAP phosphatase NrnA [bacterium]
MKNSRVSQKPRVSDRMADVAKLIRSKKTFVLTTHVNPDGDGLGAQSAMYVALKRLGKTVYVVNHDPLIPRYTFLPFAKAYRQSDKIPSHDVCIVMDAGDFSRIREGVRREEFGILVNIDHHYSNNHYGDYNLVMPKAAATGEVVYDLIKTLKIKIDKLIAESIYVSVVTDTGGFRNSNTTPDVLRLAAELMEKGADGAVVNKKIFSGISKEAMELNRLSLGKIKLFDAGKIGTMTLSQADFKKTGAVDDDTENLVNQIGKIDTVKISAFLKERKDGKIKLSLRSGNEKVNVADVAREFHGGGHTYAAGAILPGPLKEALNQVLKVCKKVLK